MKTLTNSRTIFLLASSIFFYSGIIAAQTEAPDEMRTIHLVVDKGAPMWLALEKRLPAKRVGEPVEAKLVEPLYAFDRVVVPAGSQVLGHVTKVDPVSHQKRMRAVLAGDFTPLREAQIEFDTLVLKEGKHVPLQTKVSADLPEVVHLESASAAPKKPQSQKSEMTELAKQEIKAKRQEAIDLLKSPGKMDRLKATIKARALALLPYHSQTLPVGTRFDAELLAPLDFGTVTCPAQELVKIGSPDPLVGVVHARLITPLSSATAQRGKPVEAVISQPMFTSDHHLVLPVGSRLEGMVLQARPARWMNRTGSLRFTFRRIVPPSGLVQTVEGNLSGVAAERDSHIKLDAEGGAHATHPKSGYVLPVLDVMLAMSTLDEVDRQDQLQHRTYEGRDVARGAAGGISFGLIGSVAAMSNHVAATAFGFYGAGWGVYNRFIARGSEVVFPIDTPMEITLGSHGTPPQQVAGAPNFVAAQQAN